jgi:hypothetical protein
VQGKYKFSSAAAPYALLIKYYLRIVVAEVLTCNKGADLGTPRGIGKFLRLEPGTDATTEMAVPIHSLLLNIQNGKYDAACFAWSKIGSTMVVVKSGNANEYLDLVLKPLMGTFLFRVLLHS